MWRRLTHVTFKGVRNSFLYSMLTKPVSFDQITMDAAQKERKEKNRNPHLDEIKEDVLYHIGLSAGSQDLQAMFGDVKFVCMGGTPHRMEVFANEIMAEIGYKLPTGTKLADISKNSHRYAMFKVGPVLSVSHGMGVPSLSILLHEMIKLMWHAGVEDPLFFRIGTCGGVGLEGGTVVITEEAVDGRLLPVHENIVLGKVVQHETKTDHKLVEQLLEVAHDLPFATVSGKTVCTNDFYEGQARLDGAFCAYTKQDKLDYLQWLKKGGVSNIEMESTCFAALTHQAGIRSAVVCVTLLDRLNEDQVTPSKETLLAWQNRPGKLVSNFIKKTLKESGEFNEGKDVNRNVNRILSYEDEPSGHLITVRSHERLRSDSLNMAL